MHSDSIACMDCEHDFHDHNDLAGCAVRDCPCTESKATLIELHDLTYPKDTP